MVKIGLYGEISVGELRYKNEDDYWNSYSLGGGLSASIPFSKLGKSTKIVIPKNNPIVKKLLDIIEFGLSLSVDGNGLDWNLQLGPNSSSWGINKDVLDLGIYMSIPISVKNKSQEFRDSVEGQKALDNFYNAFH